MKTPQEFIAFFKAIPENQWGTGILVDDQGKRCALGLLGCNENWQDTQDAKQLCLLFETMNWFPALINDGDDSRFRQRTPKKRILAALKNLIK